MKRTLVLSCAAVFWLAGFAPSLASAGPPVARQKHQQVRIHQGIHTGTLAPGEVRRLEVEQRAIAATRRRMVADDGKLGPAERARLDNMQDRSSRHIFRAKHNFRAR